MPIKITLNVNAVTSPIKRDKWLNGLKNKTQLYAAYKRLILALRTHIGSKWRDGKWYSKQMEPKREKVAILISDKVDFKSKTLTRDRYIMIKGSIHEENITIIYAPSIRAPKYI